MATAPATPIYASLIDDSESTIRSSQYPDPFARPIDQSAPSGSRESVYAPGSGSRRYFITPAWDEYLTTTADAAYNPIDNIDDDSITSSMLNIAARGWNQTCAFSAVDTDTVQWGAGSFIASDGTTYAIGAGNTGNMAAKTYVYLDILTSTVAYQVTTNPANVIGDGKVFIAVCINNSTEATFNVLNSDLYNIDANNIVANTLSVISANLGTITAGSLSAVTITGSTITGSTIQTALSPNARLELDSTNGLRVYNSANTLVAQLTQTLVGGSYFNSDIAKLTDLRTNDINATNGGGPISIDAGTGAVFGGSAELIIDGSASVGKHQFKADGTVRVTINPSGLTINSGGLSITSGNSTITSGDLTLTSGNLSVGGTIGGGSGTLNVLGNLTTSGTITVNQANGGLVLGLSGSSGVQLRNSNTDEVTVNNHNNTGLGDLVCRNLTVSGTYINLPFFGGITGSLAYLDLSSSPQVANFVDGIWYS